MTVNVELDVSLVQRILKAKTRDEAAQLINEFTRPMDATPPVEDWGIAKKALKQDYPELLIFVAKLLEADGMCKTQVLGGLRTALHMLSRVTRIQRITEVKL